MECEKESIAKVEALKCGEHVYFNMFQDGGAVCYECNGMYLLFEVPLYGGRESYEGTYFKNQIPDLIEKAYSWT